LRGDLRGRGEIAKAHVAPKERKLLQSSIPEAVK
jgi:hypothetical protein